jgi:hypothetical protein
MKTKEEVQERLMLSKRVKCLDKGIWFDLSDKFGKPLEYETVRNYLNDDVFIFFDEPQVFSEDEEYSTCKVSLGVGVVADMEGFDVKVERDKVKELSEFEKVADSMASLLRYKNEKYGNAVLEPVNIFSGKCKAGTRLDDKLSRIKNNKELLKNDVSDLIGYLMLTCIEKGWDNFDEFKD